MEKCHNKLAILIIMILGLFVLEGCYQGIKIGNKLREGRYIDDEEQIELTIIDRNTYRLTYASISLISIRNYQVEDGKLFLDYYLASKLVFKIEDDNLIYETTIFDDDESTENDPMFKDVILRLTFKEEPIEDMIELRVWQMTSGIRNNEVILKSPFEEAFGADFENAIFECSTELGMLLYEKVDSKTLTLSAGQKFNWSNKSGNYDEIDYIDIIVKINNNIVGYAVIKVAPTSIYFIYSSSIIKSVIFPKNENGYQKVTRKDVLKLIAQVKENPTI